MLSKSIFNIIRKWLLAEIHQQQQERGFARITAGQVWVCAGIAGRATVYDFEKAFPKVAKECGLREDGTGAYTDETPVKP